MSAADHLGAYAEGWTKGDGNTILKALSDDFTFDDPNAGRIAKGEFAEYLSGMKEIVRSLRGGNLPDPFMELSEVVTQEWPRQAILESLACAFNTYNSRSPFSLAGVHTQLPGGYPPGPRCPLLKPGIG